ncbi:MAG: hypothetical protein M1444_03795 [Patescibacteria group bacterium]|nr:hypothetical protein [Patescibacteria group bacterium]
MSERKFESMRQDLAEFLGVFSGKRRNEKQFGLQTVGKNNLTSGCKLL